jgi:hypothetical protein
MQGQHLNHIKLKGISNYPSSVYQNNENIPYVLCFHDNKSVQSY